ncbi:MAG: YjfB family protein [Huintestinicola sp.]
METSIAAMASVMKQTELMTNIGTAVMKKSLDTVETQGNAIVEMAQNLPKFSGDIGSVLDVRA